MSRGYVRFALVAECGAGLYIETAGTMLFSVLAALGIQCRSIPLLAPGGTLHPLWDVGVQLWDVGVQRKAER